MVNYEMLIVIIAASVFFILEMLLVFKNKKMLSVIEGVGDIPTTMTGFFAINFIFLMLSMIIALILTGITALLIEFPKVLSIICVVLLVKIVLAKIFLRKSKKEEDD